MVLKAYIIDLFGNQAGKKCPATNNSGINCFSIIISVSHQIFSVIAGILKHSPGCEGEKTKRKKCNSPHNIQQSQLTLFIFKFFFYIGHTI